MNPWITFALWMLGLFVVVFVITTLYLWLEVLDAFQPASFIGASHWTHNAEHEDDRLAAFQNGYDAATVKERQRSVLLIADAYGKALSAARDAVAAECIAHHGYTPGQTCPYCTDALAAIDALLKEKP